MTALLNFLIVSYNLRSPYNQQKWWKNDILLFSSLIDGRPSSGINIVANTEFFLSIRSMS